MPFERNMFSALRVEASSKYQQVIQIQLSTATPPDYNGSNFSCFDCSAHIADGGYSMIGKSVSHYRIIDNLGQGGMVEVYRAADGNLHRHVATRMMSSDFTHDPGQLARFQRKAELLSSQNRPDIATIHGLKPGVYSR
jgi:hypothetical protein